MGSDRKTTFQRVAAELATAFETVKHDNGKSYVRRRADCPDWIDTDLILGIHNALDSGDARLPSDWVYSEIRDIAQAIAEYDRDSARRARDDRHEIADSRVDAYNAARSEWLADHIYNAQIVDDAVSDGLCDASASIFDRIGSGQYLAATRIYDAIVDAIDTEADSRDDLADPIIDTPTCADDLSAHPSAKGA